jgi:hypothetical protein
MIRACCIALLLAAATAVPAVPAARPVPRTNIKTTDNEEILDAMDNVLGHKEISWVRSTIFGLANMGDKTLTEPRGYCQDGYLYNIMPFVIKKGETALILTVKSHGAALGVNCVVTYEIEDTEFKVAIMAYNPFNRAFRSNHVNARVFRKTAVIESIMAKMLDTSSKSQGGWKHQEEFGVSIRYSQSVTSESTVIALIDTSKFNANGEPDSVECSSGSCWKETLQAGASSYYCWTGQTGQYAASADDTYDIAVDTVCTTKADCEVNAPCKADLKKQLDNKRNEQLEERRAKATTPKNR